MLNAHGVENIFINPGGETAPLQATIAKLESKHKRLHHGWRNLALSAASQRPISPDWLCHCISQVIDEETILLNHLISHQASITEQIRRSKPGTLFGCAGGSISWALGALLLAPK